RVERLQGPRRNAGGGRQLRQHPARSGRNRAARPARERSPVRLVAEGRMTTGEGRPKLISIVTPVCNEAATVGIFHERLSKALAPYAGRYRFEFIFSDNRSTDDTAARIRTLRSRDPRVQLLALSRNFGYQASMVAGMRQASGDAVVFID